MCHTQRHASREKTGAIISTNAAQGGRRGYLHFPGFSCACLIEKPNK